MAVGAVLVLFDVAFWSGTTFGPGGFGLCAFLTGVPFALALATPRIRRSGRLVGAGLLLLAVAARLAWHATPGAAMFGMVLLGLFALCLRTRATFLPESLTMALGSMGRVPQRLGQLFGGLQQAAARTRFGSIAVLPIVVPLALTGTFLGVFALANPVVAALGEKAFELIGRVLALPAPGRIFTWALILPLALVLVRPAIRARAIHERADLGVETSEVRARVVRNALLSSNLLFLAYNALDAFYLWSGSPPAGMRTQDYAHRGAFWLTVALVLLTVCVSSMFKGALVAGPEHRRSRTMAYLWLGQGFLLALGTYRRIGIHVAFSGLSNLRIVGVLGTTLVVVGMVLVGLKIRRARSLGWLVRRQLDALLLVTAFYTVLPTHAVAARINVARVMSGEFRPILHTFSQAREPESATALLPLLRHPDERIRQGVAALLSDAADDWREELDASARRGRGWHGRDPAMEKAIAELEGRRDELDAVLRGVTANEAREVLLEMVRVASDGSFEELLAIPSASARSGASRSATEY